jgi:hypothetical protein
MSTKNMSTEPTAATQITHQASPTPPFWTLACYDEHGGLLYAYGEGNTEYDPGCRWPTQFGWLTSRPAKARPFASQEDALAARPLFAGWIKEELSAHIVREQDMLAVYPDGSGLASAYLREGMSVLTNIERNVSTVRAFVQKHLELLAGLAWEPSIFCSGADIKIRKSAYRGQPTTASQVAALFPVKWKRKKSNYRPDGKLVYDWVAQVDGVTLTIEKAEVIVLRPRDTGVRDGTIVDLGDAVEEMEVEA